jgi:hypothetical protein
MKSKKPFIKWDNTAENMTHIGDLDARKTDNHTNSDLHDESCNRWDLDPTFSDGIEIIDE